MTAPSRDVGERLRVLRVIARMNVGGPARQVVALHTGLDPERFEQRLVTGTVARDEADYLELRAPHVEVERIASLGRSVRVGGDVRALVALAREIRRFRPHIVHTHTAKAGFLGRLAALTQHVPATVHTFHGHLLHGYFPRPLTRALVTAERVLARRTTRLVAVGSRVRDDLLAAGIGRPGQFAVVPPGLALAPPPDRLSARALLGLPQDAQVVAFVARLTRVKRPDRFIETARHIAEKRDGALFLVVGEGAELPAMREAARTLGDRVRFLGWRSDVESVYAAADVVLVTSDNEGMPVSLIEAAMAGCPAVTTDVGSAAEVVLDGTTGFVTTTEVDDLATATLRILDDPALRQRLSANATADAPARFGRQRLIDDMAALYEELASEKGFASAPS